MEPQGWEWRGRSLDIRRFTNDLSIKSRLQFLRNIPRARKKVEGLYLRCVRESSEAAK